MAFDLNVGSITTLLGDFFLMSIQDANTKEKLPCNLLELSEMASESIPSSPQDSNSFVSDTIFKNPIMLSIRAFVYGNRVDDFESMLLRAQESELGFIVNGVNKTYINMRWVEKSFRESAEMIGGVIYNLTFQEVLFIKSFNEALSADQVSKLQDSAKVEGGIKNAQMRSTLKGVGSGFFGN